MQGPRVVEVRIDGAWVEVGALRGTRRGIAFLDAGPARDVVEIEIVPADGAARRTLRKWAYTLMAATGSGPVRVRTGTAVEEEQTVAPLSLTDGAGGAVKLRGKRPG